MSDIPEIDALKMKLIVQREFIGYMLSWIAKTQSDSEEFYRLVSLNMDERISNILDSAETDLQPATILQAEKDMVLNVARQHRP